MSEKEIIKRKIFLKRQLIAAAEKEINDLEAQLKEIDVEHERSEDVRSQMG